MRYVLLAAACLASSAALAGTPAFNHTFDNDSFAGGRIPQHFPAELGEVYVLSTQTARLVDDPTCDSLSTKVLMADLPDVGSGDMRVLFVH